MIGTRHSNSTAAQEQRMLDALHDGPVTTLQARRDLDVMHPAGRVMSLRAKGFNIITMRVQEATDCGKPHAVGKYVLFAAKEVING